MTSNIYAYRQIDNILAYLSNEGLDPNTVNMRDFQTVDFYYAPGSGCDVCGKCPISYCYVVKHKEGKGTMVVGSECVKNYQFLNMHAQVEKSLKREMARQKRQEKKLRQYEEALERVEAWKNQNRLVVDYLEANPQWGGERKDQNGYFEGYWNQFALDRINSTYWVSNGQLGPNISEKWMANLVKAANEWKSPQPVQPKPEAPKTTTFDPNLETRVGRMTAGLLEAENKKAKVIVTVSVYKNDVREGHQTFDLKKWVPDGGDTLLFVSLHGSGDYLRGVKPTNVLNVNLTKGTVKPSKGMDAPNMAQVVFAAKKALEYAFTGEVVQPEHRPELRIEAEESTVCGRCGIELTHPDSIAYGIGPECRKKANTGTTFNQQSKEVVGA